MIKSPSVYSNNYSLQNLDNYLKTINPKMKTITLYDKIVTEYLELCASNITINDIVYAKFIIYKGIEMISHIFNTIFLCKSHIKSCGSELPIITDSSNQRFPQSPNFEIISKVAFPDVVRL